MQQSTNKASVRAARIPAVRDETAAQVLHFPTPLLRDLEKKAARLGRSIGWCLSQAWQLADRGAGSELEAAHDERLLGGKRRPHRVELPLYIWRHLTAEAEHLDRSRSWLMQRAWLLARTRIVTA